jgi:DNA-binding NtrC family response regulator
MRFEPRRGLPSLHFGVFVGESPVMLELYRMLEKIARTETSCLITGESGTGKELAAQVIHQLSSRNEAALVPVNCGAIPENLLESEFFGHRKGAFTGAVADHKGRFALAHGGTLFLDEIGEMLLALQVKLLRALQTGEIQPVGSSRPVTVDVRVVAATNRNLTDEMAGGRFREDLYYRLAIVPIEMPALRDRHGDIPLLIRFMVEAINKRAFEPVKAITQETLDALCSYRWPGNVRELSAVLERMIILADDDVLGLDDLPGRVSGGETSFMQAVEDEPVETLLPDDGLVLSIAVDRFETGLILQALERTDWNKNQAAQLLKMNRTTLVEKLKKKNLTRETAADVLRALEE